MKLTKSQGGIICPIEEKKQIDRTKAWNTYTFHVYYFQDLPKYLIKLDKEGAFIISVARDLFRNGLSAGFCITYHHHEEVSMEVLC